ncbi:MAG: hypothetical protein IMY84_04760 [Chloroflexi bacterium]|nr:hypothetical protein [Chloroflexota bacterium]
MREAANRLMLRRILPIIAVSLFLTLAVLPSTADAWCWGGRCPSGDDDDSDRKVQVNITLSVVPEEAGIIEVDGDELDTDVFEVTQGKVVVLEAVPASGYEFDYWSGSLSSTDNPLEMPFYNHKTITAHFVSHVSQKKEPDSARDDGSALVVLIPKGTTARDADGDEVTDVSVDMRQQHDVASDRVMAGQVFDLGPDGATFDPPLPIVLPYDPWELPDGVREDELRVAYYDDASDTWVELPSVVDQDGMTVTAEVSHFTEFSIIAPKPESDVLPLMAPGFSISSLTVAPAQPRVGDTVTVSVVARYDGSDAEGSSAVVLSLNGEVVRELSITLEQGESKTVAFTVSTQDEATYEVDVNGVGGTFSVAAAAPPEALSQAVALAEEDSSAFSGIRLPGWPALDWQPVALIAGVVVLPLLLLLPLLKRRFLRYRYDI